MEHRRSQDSEKKVHIKLKTDLNKQDPRSITAPKDKSALKKDGIPSSDTSLTEHRDSQQRFSDASIKHPSEQNALTEDEKLKKNKSKDEAEEREARALADTRENDVDRKVPTSNLKEVADQEKSTDSSLHESTLPKSNVKNDQEGASIIQSEYLPPEVDSLKKVSSKQVVLGDSKDEENAEASYSQSPSPPKEVALRESKDEEVGEESYLPSLSEFSVAANERARHAEDSPYDTKLLSPPSKHEMASSQENVSAKEPKETAIKPKEGEGSISYKEENGTKEQNSISYKEENGIKEQNSISYKEENGIKEQKISKPLPSIEEDLAVKSISSNENERLDEMKMARNSGNDLDKKDIIVSKVSVHNDNDALDTPNTKIAIKVRKKTNEDLDQSAIGGKGNNSEGTEEEEVRKDSIIRLSDITTTLNSSRLIIHASTESAKLTERSLSVEGSTAEKEASPQGLETNNNLETQGNNGDKLNQDENSVKETRQVAELKDFEKNDPDKAEDSNDDNDGLPTLLERTNGSEDLRINELKKQVRPGQVFVVRGDPDCYTVKWAEKRKVLAYKVGSRNTSRFSTVLIETVEQLERASVRHPSILSELKHPTTDAKGSLLSTYFAGADDRRSIKDNLIREMGTNTGEQNEFETIRQKSPEYNFFAKDHISPDLEAFGGVAPNQPTTAEPTIQSNNYNYPFLTDYDVNHERKVNK